MVDEPQADQRDGTGTGSDVDSARSAPSVWRPVVVATVVAAATSAGIWWIAVPLESACPVGPVACGTLDKQAAGVAWTTAIAVAWLVTVGLALTVGRRRGWVTQAAVWALIAVAVVGYGAVQGPGGSWTP